MILKKLKEFPRDHTDSSAVTVKSETLVLNSVIRDEYFFILDELREKINGAEFIESEIEFQIKNPNPK